MCSPEIPLRPGGCSSALEFAVGVIAAVLQLFPTGDAQGKLIAQNQPITLAAMEGLFETQNGAPLAILGQPDMEKTAPR